MGRISGLGRVLTDAGRSFGAPAVIARLIFRLVVLLALFWFDAGAARAQDAEAKPRDPAGGALSTLSVSGIEDCHSQGITVTGDYLFASCVDRKDRRAMLYRFLLPDGFPASEGRLADADKFDVTSGAMYHPSGLDHDRKCLWVATSHYRSFMARSKVTCFDPSSMEELSSFEVEDHVGALAVAGDNLFLFNWDSADVYLYAKDGEWLGKSKSPGSVAYQDCRGIATRGALCSGSGKATGEGKPPAVVELIRFDPQSGKRWAVTRRRQFGNSVVRLGAEGFTLVEDYLIFLPEDFPKARLLLYAKPK